MYQDSNRNHSKPGRKGRMALISTPWPFFDRPSIQLGTLKAFLNQHLPHLSIDAHHAYLKIAQALGYSLYQQIGERSWIAECPYAALLHPNRMDIVGRFWRRKARGAPSLLSQNFKDLCRRIEAASHSIIDTEPWERYFLIGFSICLAQLTSSLYFIREIKRCAPHIPIVVGGSACSGPLGRSLLKGEKSIDYVIGGEGELPLLQLVRKILDGGDPTHVADIPGLVHKDNTSTEITRQQVPGLDALPIPDYTDYLRILKSSPPGHAFMPRLPMEMSRGCWWRKKTRSNTREGCAFCNLNLQWTGYRRKSAVRTVLEIKSLVNRHQLLSIFFMDNLLPAKGLESLFHDIQHLGMDLQMYSEIRADTPVSVLEAMGKAGMREVQVGIEALSTSLLKKLNKGTTAMDNLEIMKNCEHARFPNLTGNLIFRFPGSDDHDVAETLENLIFAFPFRPLNGVPLWLGYGSPLRHNPARHGIRLTGNHPHYKHLFPKEDFEKFTFPMQGYHGGVREQKRLWEPVRKRLREWRKFYHGMHGEPGFQPILSYRDGKNFLVIHKRRLNHDPMTHRLKATSRAIYLFCETQRSMGEIVARFPRFGEEQIAPFLRMMVEKRVMFHEGDRYLSLAVPDPFHFENKIK